jgi:hypothetical protein
VTRCNTCRDKKPPPGVAGDMFKEMAWKKRQKELKKAAGC